MVKISRLFFYLIIIFYVWVFTGFHLYWKNIIYDEWRVISILLLFILSLLSILNVRYKDNKALVMGACHKIIIFLILFIFIFLFFNLNNYLSLEFALVDFSLYTLLLLGTIGLYKLHIYFMEDNEGEIVKFYLLISFTPFFVIIYFVFSLILFWLTGSFFEWKTQFSNIRMYDSVILIFIFILLNFKQFISNSIINAFSVFLLGCYILSLFFDNARSALLSLLVGMASIFFLYKNMRKILILPVLLTIISGLVYWFYQIFYPINTMVRVTSSGRSTLWVYAWEKWLQYPIVGIGGAGFGLDQEEFRSRSVHNLVIQMVGEWGVIGYIYLGIIGLFIHLILIYRQSIPPFLVAGVIAIIVDSMFSAVLIYPLLMFVCANFFALTLAYCPRQYKINSYEKTIFIKKTLYLFSLFFSAYIIINIHGSDILCVGCGSMDGFHSPRFWEYGRALHLRSVDKGLD